MDRDVARTQIREAQRSLHQLLGRATVADLRRASNGTRWHNGLNATRAARTPES